MMRNFGSRACVLAATLGCASCTAPPSAEGDAEFRCLAVDETIAGVGIIGLNLVEVSGNPSIDGPGASVFSNKLVALSGGFDIYGDAIGGGHVTIDGSNYPHGQVIEDVGLITIPDPTPEVLAAKLTNDNHTIPCVGKGSNCESPVSNYQLNISSQDDVVLKTGTYYFEGISINGQGQLSIDGHVVIYLNGAATFNGGSATNPTSDSLHVISSSTGEIKLNGGADSEMHIFAPNATVRFAGTQGFRGTAIGSIVRVNGTADLELTQDLLLGFAQPCADEEEDLGGETGTGGEEPSEPIPELPS